MKSLLFLFIFYLLFFETKEKRDFFQIKKNNENFFLHNFTSYPLKFTEFEEKKSKENYSFIIYSLEFITSSIWPSLFTYLVYVSTPSPFGYSFIYTGLNSITIPSMTHFIGTIAKKEGNIKNSIVGSLIGSLPGIFIIHNNSKHHEKIKANPHILLFMAISPPLGGVIGYNLKF